MEGREVEIREGLKGMEGWEWGGRYGKEFPTLTAVGTSVDALVVAAADSRLL